MVKNMKHIRRFNESKVIDKEDDIREALLEFEDEGIKIRLENRFFSESGGSDEYLGGVYNKPGVSIYLYKEKINISTDFISEINDLLYSCLSKLIIAGDPILKEFDLSYNLRIEISLLYNEKKVELSKTEKFYDFVEEFRHFWLNSKSRIMQSNFEFKTGLDEIILNPKEGVDPKSMLSKVKTILKNKFDTWKQTIYNRTRYEYIYDVKLIDGKIHVIYKEFFNIDRWGNRINR
jgi:hypothetical protein